MGRSHVGIFNRIPKGFRHKAQSCAAGATLGDSANEIDNPNGVATAARRQPLGRNPVGVVGICALSPRVGARDSRQPWAVRPNAVGVQRYLHRRPFPASRNTGRLS